MGQYCVTKSNKFIPKISPSRALKSNVPWINSELLNASRMLKSVVPVSALGKLSNVSKRSVGKFLPEKWNVKAC